MKRSELWACCQCSEYKEIIIKPVLWLASVAKGHAMDCVIGHEVDLGQQISLIKGNPNYSHCKWIQVVHTAPEEIGMYKSISEGQQKQQIEIELC